MVYHKVMPMVPHLFFTDLLMGASIFTTLLLCLFLREETRRAAPRNGSGLTVGSHWHIHSRMQTYSLFTHPNLPWQGARRSVWKQHRRLLSSTPVLLVATTAMPI